LLEFVKTFWSTSYVTFHIRYQWSASDLLWNNLF